MIHDARVVPMTPRPHLPSHIRQLHGDPRGRWDGDTLVVETTNYINGFQGSTPNVELTERYTRVSPDFINWEITVEDPATWTKPYTFMIRLKKTDGLDLRVRVPRRQLRDGRHPGRRPARRGQGHETMSHPLSRRQFGRTIGSAAVGAGLYSGQATTEANQTQGSTRSSTTSGDDIVFLSAIELAARIRKKQISAREVMTAHLAQIERVNAKVNAIVTLVADRAMADASRADEMQARGGKIGVLHGLPVAHKDLVDTAGIRTTRGSPFYRDRVPTQDAAIVTRIRSAGAVTIGKTNTPNWAPARRPSIRSLAPPGIPTI